jgi:phage terminase small subunit
MNKILLNEQDQLQQRDSLVSMYQEQYTQLTEQAARCREQADASKKVFRVRSYFD